MYKMQNKLTHILSVGSDCALLNTREMVLQKAGYTVCSLSDRSIAAEMQALPFDLVLLCHSVPLDRAEEISRFARSCNPAAVAVRLNPMYSERASTFDLTCDVSSGPVRLLNELDKLRRLTWSRLASTTRAQA